jgi:hypothetical protein
LYYISSPPSCSFFVSFIVIVVTEVAGLPRNSNTSFAAASDCRMIAIYEYTRGSKRRCVKREAYRPYTEAVGSLAQMRCVSSGDSSKD